MYRTEKANVEINGQNAHVIIIQHASKLEVYELCADGIEMFRGYFWRLKPETRAAIKAAPVTKRQNMTRDWL